MKTLFEYADYRDFISALMFEKNITASSIAEELGLKSKSYLGLILRGKKHLQPHQIHFFRRIFNLTAGEFDFFFHLVHVTNAHSIEEKTYHKLKLDEIRNIHGKSVRTAVNNQEILSRWYHPTLLLNSTLKVPLTDEKLARKLKLSQTELQTAFTELKEKALMKIDNGQIRTAALTKLKVSKQSWNKIQKNYLKNQIKNSLDVFDSSYESTGKFYSQTLTLANGSFDDVWQLLKNKLDALADRSDLEPEEELIQINLQLFKIIP